MKRILAFDYGASSGRAIVGSFDGNKLSLEEVHRFQNEPLMMGKTFTWDFPRLLFELKAGIAKAQSKGYDISSMGIDTWGVDFGLLSSKDELLGNPTHYRDSQTDDMIELAQSIIPKERIYAETGIAFQKFNTLYQLLAMTRNGSETLKAADRLLFMPDLMNFFLTGVKACEYTIASTSQMYDSVKGSWSYDLMNKLGIRTDILGEVVPSGTKIGGLSDAVCKELGVKSIPVIAVAEHDTGSAVAAVPFKNTKGAYISSGTWSLLGAEIKKPVINESTLSFNYTNEGGAFGTIRLLKNIMGLWISQECRRYWIKKGENLSFDELEEGAKAATPFASIINVDAPEFFEPGHMPEKVVEFCRKTGQKVPETKGEIVRCIMESLALKYRMAIEELEKIVGYKVPVLHIVGGGCKEKTLCRFTAEAIDRPVVAGPVEATAIGNLAVQLISLGEAKNIKEARAIISDSFEKKDYFPDPSKKAQWDDAYEKLQKLL